MPRLQSQRNQPLFTDGASDLAVMRSEALSFTPPHLTELNPASRVREIYE